MMLIEMIIEVYYSVIENPNNAFWMADYRMCETEIIDVMTQSTQITKFCNPNLITDEWRAKFGFVSIKTGD